MGGEWLALLSIMRSILVTATDTGVGKTRVCGALARLLAATGARVQIVKLVETGRGTGYTGDAVTARRLADVPAIEAITCILFPGMLAPLAAAAEKHEALSLDRLIAAYEALPVCDWRIVEGAGGIAVPLDAAGQDWTDLAEEAELDEVILVVADRLGAINQTRLAHAYATQRGLSTRVWLNASSPVDPLVAASHRTGLAQVGIGIFASQRFDAVLPEEPEVVLEKLIETGPSSRVQKTSEGFVARRAQAALAQRESQGLRRSLRLFERSAEILNLADNDYLDLARDPVVQAAMSVSGRSYGTSASASPLITGWGKPQARLLDDLCSWHGYTHGLLWSSGYAANSAVLGTLLEKGDLALADRLIHHSMIAGLRRSGARLKRYAHLDLQRLEADLASAEGRPTAVITESVFSMDGDFPDFGRMASLKQKYGFFWVVDEAHALGWYGPGGAGLVRAAELQGQVDVLVGTLGKTLASAGAYSLFKDEAVRDFVLNHAGEFIYSTGIPPTAAAAASAALARTKELSVDQGVWQATSRNFRQRLRSDGWEVPEGDSPVVPVLIGPTHATIELAARLRAAGVVVGAVRPPTVPEGTSRLRFSLKRTLTSADIERVAAVMEIGRRR